jgi:DNA-binding FadR family transcriptional regulator
LIVIEVIALAFAWTGAMLEMMDVPVFSQLEATAQEAPDEPINVKDSSELSYELHAIIEQLTGNPLFVDP